LRLTKEFLGKKEVKLNNVYFIRKVAMSGSNPFGETSVVIFKRPFLEACLSWLPNYPVHVDVDMYLGLSRFGEKVLNPEIVGKLRFESVNNSTVRSKNLFVVELKNSLLKNIITQIRVYQNYTSF
jgi:hypothetical protein